MLDIHRHWREGDCCGGEGVTTVYALRPDDDVRKVRRCTVGIHPWEVDDGWEQEFERLCAMMMQQDAEADDAERRIVGIGECGLDKVCRRDGQLQMACFAAQVALARERQTMLVVHCVKAWEELLRMVDPQEFGANPVIVHGFRGKPQLAAQLLGRGFHLSFGRYYHAESLRMAFECRRMWLETDDADVGIAEIYASAGRVLNMSATDIEVPGGTTLGAISANG